MGVNLAALQRDPDEDTDGTDAAIQELNGLLTGDEIEVIPEEVVHRDHLGPETIADAVAIVLDEHYDELRELLDADVFTTHVRHALHIRVQSQDSNASWEFVAHFRKVGD